MEEKTIKEWRILDSEYLFRRPWLTARKDKVELPDGRVNPEYYVLEYPAWVNVIAVTADGKFVMVEQYRHGIGCILTELCAGVVEDGEEPLAAARRELMEETGYGGGEWSLLNVLSSNASACSNLTYCYLAQGVRLMGRQNLDATEDVVVKVLDRAEVYDMLESDQMKQSLMAAPLWHYFCKTCKR